MTAVWKTCNCCLTRNHFPVLMTERASIRYCRKCKTRTVWSGAAPEVVATYLENLSKREATIEWLLAQ